VAELEGHVSRSAVYLIHGEVRTGAWEVQWRKNRQASIAKNRMLSHDKCERPVIVRTETAAGSWTSMRCVVDFP
jgi:hypothetical protein